MSIAALAGLGTGALHAVSGPDHLLSLAPLSVGVRRKAWKVGLVWGLGHALGTLVCAGTVLWVASMMDLDVLSAWGDRLAGLALLVTGTIGLCRWRAHHAAVKSAVDAKKVAPVASMGGVLSIGLIHGVTGAAAVLLLLPAAVAASVVWKVVYLGGFALGSTLAMAGLTAALAAGSRLMPRPETLLRNVPAVASFGSVLLGGWWVVA